LLHGSSQALVQVTTYSITATVFPRQIAKVIGIIEISWGIGIAVGPLVAQVLFNLGGFSLPLLVYAVVMLILAILTCILMTDEVEGHENDQN
jgi:MFS family permease